MDNNWDILVEKCLYPTKASNWDITMVKGLALYFGNVYGITLVIDVGIELGYLDGPFDGSNDEKLEVLLIAG